MRAVRRLRPLALVLALSPALAPCSAPSPAPSPSSGPFAPAPGAPFATGPRPVDLVIGDVDGSGTLDVIVANAGADNLSVLLGDGRGGFRPAGPPIPISPAPHLLALGDVSGDGRSDLAVTAHDSNAVTIFLNDGRGTFAKAPGSPFPLFGDVRPHNHGLALGDVNGDGHLDVTAGHQDAGTVAVLLGDGTGAFSAAAGSPVRAGRAIYPHALVDLNRDGRLDIAAPDLSGSVAVLLGDGRGGFAPAPGPPI